MWLPFPLLSVPERRGTPTHERYPVTKRTPASAEEPVRRRRRKAQPKPYDEQDVRAFMRRTAARDEAERRMREEKAGAGFRPPLPGTESGLLSELIDREPEHELKLIDGVLGRQQNAILAGQYKAGKTRLGMNEMRACVDGLPFLGRATHFNDGGRFGWFDGEMNKDDWNDYVRPMGIRNLQDIAVMHLRGLRLDLLNDFVAEYVTGWLVEHDVTDWRIDSLRRLLAWSGVALNDNDGASLLTNRIDQIKREAGVLSCVILAHTGRAKVEHGAEHVMGATEWDAWADSRQLLTTEDGARFFSVVGRGVAFEESLFLFDSETGLIDVAGGPAQNRRLAEQENIAIAAEAIVSEQPGINTSALAEQLGKKFNRTNHNEKSALVTKARDSGRIHVHQKGTSRLHFLGATCSECP